MFQESRINLRQRISDNVTLSKKWKDAEKAANEMLGLYDSNNLLPVLDMTHADSYQYKLVERPSAGDFIEMKVNAKLKVFGTDYEFAIIDKIKELQCDINDRVIDLMFQVATPRQSQVVKLRLDGYTQVDVGKILGCNQSSVVKCITGNTSYNMRDKNGNALRYGGLIKKTAKAMDKDPVYLELKKELDALLLV